MFLAHKTYRSLTLLNSQKNINFFCYFNARVKLTSNNIKPVGIYLSKVNNRNIRTRCEICEIWMLIESNS